MLLPFFSLSRADRAQAACHCRPNSRRFPTWISNPPHPKLTHLTSSLPNSSMVSSPPDRESKIPRPPATCTARTPPQWRTPPSGYCFAHPTTQIGFKKPPKARALNAPSCSHHFRAHPWRRHHAAARRGKRAHGTAPRPDMLSAVPRHSASSLPRHRQEPSARHGPELVMAWPLNGQATSNQWGPLVRGS